MAVTGTSVPGNAIPGQARPGLPGPAPSPPSPPLTVVGVPGSEATYVPALIAAGAI